MKNLKKLNRNELKTITGNGLFEVINVVGSAVGGVVSRVSSLPQAIMDDIEPLAHIHPACTIRCLINGSIKILECGTAC